jgi:hypothetical protein
LAFRDSSGLKRLSPFSPMGYLSLATPNQIRSDRLMMGFTPVTAPVHQIGSFYWTFGQHGLPAIRKWPVLHNRRPRTQQHLYFLPLSQGRGSFCPGVFDAGIGLRFASKRTKTRGLPGLRLSSPSRSCDGVNSLNGFKTFFFSHSSGAMSHLSHLSWKKITQTKRTNRLRWRHYSWKPKNLRTASSNGERESF